MIDTATLQCKVNGYWQRCMENHSKPTHAGIGAILGISRPTVSNVVRGTYNNGRKYTERPSATRCISNADFEILQGLFS